MKSIAQQLLPLGALCVLAATPARSAEPEFEKLFMRPDVVGEGWVVRNWMDVSEPPEWPVVWEVTRMESCTARVVTLPEPRATSGSAPGA